MPLQTTTIGSYPKPAYLPTLDWFRKADMSETMGFHNKVNPSSSFEEFLITAEKQVIKEQSDIGVSVITDGELRRECYYLHLCRKLNGFDFENFEVIPIRNNACRIAVPVIKSRIENREPSAWSEWKQSQDLSDRPVKYTIPGPMTILDSVKNDFYVCKSDASEDLIKAINEEIKDLVKHGCHHIQLDEPLLVRDTNAALNYGIQNAERCFDGVGDHVQKTIHICCGYPSYLDQEDYRKADNKSLDIIANRLDNSIFDCISIEDAQCHNDLALFERFKTKILVIGVVKIASSKIESVQQIRERVDAILKVLPKDRLILSPDCGLGYLVDDTIRQNKLMNMVQVANSFE